MAHAMIHIMAVPSFLDFHPASVLHNADALKRQVQQVRQPIGRRSSQDKTDDQLTSGNPFNRVVQTICQQEQESQDPKSAPLSKKKRTPLHHRLKGPIQELKADRASPACYLPSGDTTPPTVEYTNPGLCCTCKNLKQQTSRKFLATHIFQECAQLLTSSFKALT